MQIGTAPKISVKNRIGDWLHSNKVMAGICGRRYAIDKSANWSIERAVRCGEWSSEVRDVPES